MQITTACKSCCLAIAQVVNLSNCRADLYEDQYVIRYKNKMAYNYFKYHQSTQYIVEDIHEPSDYLCYLNTNVRLSKKLLNKLEIPT